MTSFFRRLFSRELTGATAERAAARFLLGRGARILERNVHIGGGEIDLITREGSVLVFVEVRFRSRHLASAAESVGVEKTKTLDRCVRAYLRKHRLQSVPYRGDVVAVTHKDGRWHFALKHGVFAHAQGSAFTTKGGRETRR